MLQIARLLDECFVLHAVKRLILTSARHNLVVLHLLVRGLLAEFLLDVVLRIVLLGLLNFSLALFVESGRFVRRALADEAFEHALLGEGLVLDFLTLGRVEQVVDDLGDRLLGADSFYEGGLLNQRFKERLAGGERGGDFVWTRVGTRIRV